MVLDEKALMQLRAKTPAWGRFSHFAHGSASLPSTAVYAAWNRWLEAESSLGTLRAIEHLAEELQTVRPTVAQLIGALPHQIALLDSASHAWSAALGAALEVGRHVHVVTTYDEYGSNSLCLLAARERLTFTLMSSRDEAEPLSVRLAEILDSLRGNSLVIVSITAIPTAYGVATDLHNVAEVAKQHNALLFIDASHAVGQISVDVSKIGCDVLVFPARKWLRGPKGIAALYLSDLALERLGIPPNIDVAGAVWADHDNICAEPEAKRFERQEFNPGLQMAFKAACDDALQIGIEEIASKNAQIRLMTTKALQTALGWEPLEAGHPRASALMTYQLPENVSEGRVLANKFWDAGVNLSYVGMQYARWALENDGYHGLIRLTPHYLTSEQEIEHLVTVASKLTT